jgi:hypothetical protein
MEATLEQIPRTGKVDLTIQVSTIINYSAEAARRLVGRFVANEISYLLRCGAPGLVVAERLYWRVPITLAFPTTGPVGTVGTIDVDVETGQLSITPEQIAEITRHAESLAAAYSTVERPAS